MKLVFCGTPQFAVPTLERLLSENYSIGMAVTNPDEPSGRGYSLGAPPVKQAALKAGLRVFQPARLKDPAVQAEITLVKPDAVVVVAYGHLIPEWMINFPPYGCVNLHASLLPRYRGAAPIPWAIMRGENTTGVTTMKIDRGLDTGDILLQEEVEIRRDDTTESLSKRLATLGAGLMVETLHQLASGEIQPRAQDPDQATLAPILKKEDGAIDWSLTAPEIGRRVRGLRPWPVAHTLFRSRNLRIWSAKQGGQSPDRLLPPGGLEVEPGKLLAGCGGNSMLEITEVQLEGRKRISASEFLNGARLVPGEKLGG
ncbi:MAG: methionyl-tRNA formyltransferase [Terriglobia bacterium]